MSDQLPAIIPPGGALTTATDTYKVPALIVAAGDACRAVIWRGLSRFPCCSQSQR
jgi:hypothetical protein